MLCMPWERGYVQTNGHRCIKKSCELRCGVKKFLFRKLWIIWCCQIDTSCLHHQQHMIRRPTVRCWLVNMQICCLWKDYKISSDIGPIFQWHKIIVHDSRACNACSVIYLFILIIDKKKHIYHMNASTALCMWLWRLSQGHCLYKLSYTIAHVPHTRFRKIWVGGEGMHLMKFFIHPSIIRRRTHAKLVLKYSTSLSLVGRSPTFPKPSLVMCSPKKSCVETIAKVTFYMIGWVVFICT